MTRWISTKSAVILIFLAAVIHGGNSAVADNYHFSEAALCSNGKYHVPAPDRGEPFKVVNSDDEYFCRTSFSFESGIDDDIVIFGVFLVKQNLEGEKKEKFLEYIIEKFIADETRVVRNKIIKNENNYVEHEYIIGLKGRGDSKNATFRASFSDRINSVLVIYSMAPTMFWTGGQSRAEDGTIVEVTDEMKNLRRYMDQWHDETKASLASQK